MALVCTEIKEWVEEEISKPVEEWEERRERRCRDYGWYDPRGWFCWFVTVFVKVVRWIVVKVGKWIIRTVCKAIGVGVDMFRDIFSGLWDVIAGIFTLDWRRFLDGLIKIFLGIGVGAIRFARILLLGDTIDYIIEEINTGRLKRYVKGLLEAQFSGDTLTQIKEAIRLDHGAFGLRLNATAYRTILDSEAPSPSDPSVPNLVALHEAGSINLRALCGFEFTEGFWNRKRYKTLKKGTVVGGGGGGEPDNPISEDELDDYLNSRGASEVTFHVLPMRDNALAKKVRTAEEKGRELALMLSFDETTVEVTDADHIVHKGYDTVVAHISLTNFLVDKIGRTDKVANDPNARAELCHPVAIGIFRYTDGLRGVANRLRDTECGGQGQDASGVTFIDNIPDEVWKYVPIHELGHYFGLCHVDGIDRIMFSPRENTWWKGWWLIPRLVGDIYLQGEPIFTFNEAKACWDFIVRHLTAECLGAHQEETPVV